MRQFLIKGAELSAWKEMSMPTFDFYRLTRNGHITVISYPGIIFDITLHSLYRKYFPAEIILLYITLS